MKIKIFLIGTVCVASFGLSYQKSFGQSIDLIQPPPESMALINQINVPVNHHTGTSPLQLHLHTVSVRNLTVPITLSYQGSGIKVQDMPSRVGLGWRLSAGGRVTRVIRGKPDEYGYSSSSPDGPTFNRHRIANDWSTTIFDQLYSGTRSQDGEPDIFYYEIPGRSGTFVFDETGTAYTVPYERIKIQWKNKTANNSSFVITDENGVIYEFEEQEHTSGTPSMAHGTYHVTSWCLTRIADGEVYNNGYNEGTQIEFTYDWYITNYKTTNGALRRRAEGITSDGQLIYSHIDTKSMDSEYYVRERLLTEIKWEGGSIRFQNMDIWGSRAKVLGSMQLFSMGKSLKAYTFSYENPTSPRFKLQQVNEQSGDGREIHTLYYFRYNQDQVLPNERGLKGTDHWGYYNGDESTVLYPAHTVEGGYVPGAHKQPTMPYTTASMLTEIVFADAARKTFVYEPNRTANGIWGGVRIKQIAEYDAGSSSPKLTRYEYTLANSSTSSGTSYTDEINYTTTSLNAPHRRTFPFNYTIYFRSLNELYDLTGSSIVYSRVKEILPNNAYNIYNYTTFDHYSDEDAQLATISGQTASNTATPTHSVPVTSFAFKRGLLTELESYSASGQRILRQVNNYSVNTSEKKIIWGYHMREEESNPNSTSKYRFLAMYRWVIQPIYLLNTVTEQGPYNLYSKTEYTYDTDYLAVKEVKVTDAEGSVHTTRMKYPFDFTYTNKDVREMTHQAAAFKAMLSNNVIHRPIVTVYMKNGKVIGGDLTKYKLVTSLVHNTAYKIQPIQRYTLSLTSPIPEEQYTATGMSGETMTFDSRFRLDATYNAYNDANYPVSIIGSDGIHRMAYYGHGNTLLIGSAEESDANPLSHNFYVNSFEEDGEE